MCAQNNIVKNFSLKIKKKERKEKREKNKGI